MFLLLYSSKSSLGFIAPLLVISLHSDRSKVKAAVRSFRCLRRRGGGQCRRRRLHDPLPPSHSCPFRASAEEGGVSAAAAVSMIRCLPPARALSVPPSHSALSVPPSVPLSVSLSSRKTCRLHCSSSAFCYGSSPNVLHLPENDEGSTVRRKLAQPIGTSTGTLSASHTCKSQPRPEKSRSSDARCVTHPWQK